MIPCVIRVLSLEIGLDKSNWLNVETSFGALVAPSMVIDFLTSRMVAIDGEQQLRLPRQLHAHLFGLVIEFEWMAGSLVAPHYSYIDVANAFHCLMSFVPCDSCSYSGV